MTDRSNSRESQEIIQFGRKQIAGALTTLALIGGFGFWVGEQQSRISRAELNIIHLQQSRMNYESRNEKKYDELKVDLRLINQKLDRLIESGLDKPRR